MPTPANRVPVRVARGTKTNINAAVVAGDLKEGEIIYVTDENAVYVIEGGVLTQAGADLSTASIDELADVDTTTAPPTDGQVLIWVNANGKWEPSDVIYDIVNDTTPQLGGDLDVQANEINTSTSNGNVKVAPNGTGVLEVRGNTGNDAAIQLNCEQNSHGVKIKSPPHSAAATYTLTLPDDAGSSGQALTTDGSGNLSWAAGGGASAIDDLTDVDTSTVAPTDGQVLTWDNTAGQWEPATPTTSGLPSANDGEALIYENGQWVAGPVIGGVSYTTSSVSARYWRFTNITVPDTGFGLEARQITLFTSDAETLTAADYGPHTYSVSDLITPTTNMSFNFGDASDISDNASDVFQITNAQLGGAGAYLQWDLGSAQTVTHIATHLRDNATRFVDSADVEYSSDGTNWTSAGSFSGVTASGTERWSTYGAFNQPTLITDPYSIDKLDDVDTTTSAPSNSSLLSYSTANQKWEPTTVSSPVDGQSLIYVNGGWAQGPNIGGYSYTSSTVSARYWRLSDITTPDTGFGLELEELTLFTSNAQTLTNGNYGPYTYSVSDGITPTVNNMTLTLGSAANFSDNTNAYVQISNSELANANASLEWDLGTAQAVTHIASHPQSNGTRFIDSGTVEYSFDAVTWYSAGSFSGVTCPGGFSWSTYGEFNQPTLMSAPYSIDGLDDVDTSTVAPTDGDVLVYDNANTKFIPGVRVKSDTTQGGTGSSAVANIVTISQVDYNALVTPDANTIYFIV